MAIPDYQTIILPLLKFYSDNQEHAFRDAVEAMANEFKLTDRERKELLPSGQQEIFDNRVGWARTYMKKACLIDSTRRGHNKITQRGLDVIKQKPQKINVDFLQQFSEFKSFLDLRHNKPDEE